MFRENESTGYIYIDEGYIRGLLQKQNVTMREARALYEEPEEEPVVIAEQTPVVLVKREEDDIEKFKKYLCDLYLAGTKMVNVLELMEKLQ